MLFLCPNLDFLFFLQYVFSPPPQPSHSKGTYWAAVVSNTQALCLSVCIPFQQTWASCRKTGLPALPTPPGGAGLLRGSCSWVSHEVRASCAWEAQCIKFCFQNLTSILTTAPKYWASTSHLCGKPQCCYMHTSLPKYRWKFTPGYVDNVLF